MEKIIGEIMRSAKCHIFCGWRSSIHSLSVVTTRGEYVWAMLRLRYAGEKNCWTDRYTIPNAREEEKSWAVSETSQIENVRFTFAP